MNYSILQNFKNSKLCNHPFPHIVIENCLNEDLYHQLTETFPNELVDIETNNKRGDIYSHQLKDENKIVWKKFLDYHCNIKFLDEVLEAFNSYFNTQKKLYNKIAKLRENKINIYPTISEYELSMSASISYNTPVIKESSVRGPHRDKSNKLYGALLYMKDEKDNSIGGDLELYCSDRSFKKIVYNKNTLVLFINNEKSFHGVSERNKTNFIRKFCYFSTICPFDLYKEKINFFHSIKKKFKKIL